MTRSFEVLFVGVLSLLSGVFCLTYNDVLEPCQVDNVRKILDYNLKGGAGYGETFNWLAEFTDTVGPRKVGTPGYQEGVKYLLPRLKANGFDNVHTETVQVPNWIRGKEEASLISPRRKTLSILGLGSSVPTPRGGVTAEVVVAHNFSHAEILGAAGRITGKILVFNPPWTSYGENSQYRRTGASVGGKYGALVTLIRSAASHSINSPHTGQQNYQDGVPKIPAACLTVEDAAMIDRMVTRGQNVTIFVKLLSHPGPTPTVDSWNVVSEITGTTSPNEIVLISGHLDSWDVGQGAMDDGGGVAISRQALQTLKVLGIQPKRTVRAVFFSSEEPGLQGSRQYYERHKNTEEKFVMVMESDIGAWWPKGFKFKGTANQTERIRAVMPLFQRMNATTLSLLDDGEDVQWWMNDGVAGGTLSERYNTDYYFQFHHSEGDTMSVFREGDLDAAAAMWAAMAYTLLLTSNSGINPIYFMRWKEYNQMYEDLGETPTSRRLSISKSILKIGNLIHRLFFGELNRIVLSV